MVRRFNSLLTILEMHLTQGQALLMRIQWLDWPLFRNWMAESYSHLYLHGFAKEVLPLQKCTFPVMSTLIFIAWVLPVVNAEFERGFSAQNRVTTKLGNGLLEGSIDHLMRISIIGPFHRNI